MKIEGTTANHRFLSVHGDAPPSAAVSQRGVRAAYDGRCGRVSSTESCKQGGGCQRHQSKHQVAHDLGGATHAPSPEILYATATGDPGTALIFPLNRVRWLTPPREIAVLVTDAGPEHLEAQLFHFGKARRDMGAELYLLSPGQYKVALTTQAGGKVLSRQTLEANGQRARARFQLPSQELCVLRIRRQAAQPR